MSSSITIHVTLCAWTILSGTVMAMLVFDNALSLPLARAHSERSVIPR